MNQLPGLVLRCVNCGSSLGVWSPGRTEYRCKECNTIYPLRDGILDFVGEQEILSKAQRSSFAVQQSDSLGRQMIDARLKALISKLPSPGVGQKYSMLLDVGGGYGDLAIAASTKFELVVSVNASLSELQSESAMLDATNTRNVALILALAQNLPFMPFQFIGVTCVQVLEHVDNPPLVLAQLRHMLKKPGFLYLSFPNRFTFRKENHTQLYGIGFLPKSWASKYADWAGKGPEYQSVHMLSARGVDRWLHKQFGARYCFIRSHSHQSLFARIADWVWKLPVMQRLVLLFAYDIEVLAWSPSTND